MRRFLTNSSQILKNVRHTAKMKIPPLKVINPEIFGNIPTIIRHRNFTKTIQPISITATKIDKDVKYFYKEALTDISKFKQQMINIANLELKNAYQNYSNHTYNIYIYMARLNLSFHAFENNNNDDVSIWLKKFFDVPIDRNPEYFLWLWKHDNIYDYDHFEFIRNNIWIYQWGEKIHDSCDSILFNELYYKFQNSPENFKKYHDILSNVILEKLCHHCNRRIIYAYEMRKYYESNDQYEQTKILEGIFNSLIKDSYLEYSLAKRTAYELRKIRSRENKK